MACFFCPDHALYGVFWLTNLGGWTAWVAMMTTLVGEKKGRDGVEESDALTLSPKDGESSRKIVPGVTSIVLVGVRYYPTMSV